MPLQLNIENETSLPDGGPLSYTLTGSRGLDIGRDQYLDWTLPDPSRAVSGKHCEVRFRDGAYWLIDVSRNGTYVNQNAQRLQEPYRLRSGDRLYIGPYIIRVQIDGEAASEPARSPESIRNPHDPWSSGEDAAPPIARRDLQHARDRRPVNADFRDWRIDLPAPDEQPDPIAPLPPLGGRRPPPPDEGMGWAQGPARPRAEPEPPPPVPRPRRPGYGAADQSWDRPAGPEDNGSESGPLFDPGNPWGQPSLAVPTPYRPEPLPPSEPAYAPPPPAPRAAPEAATRGLDSFVERFAKGAGVPAETFAGRDPGDLAEELGGLTRLTTESLKQLLAARAEAKRMTRASSQTTIQALDNNPLKFTPTVEDALRIMFGRRGGGYLSAHRAMEESFRDLKTHQVKVYSAMQHALRLLLEDLDPEAIEVSLGDDRGLGGLLGSRKARLWDLYATRWDALTAAHEEGIADAFMVFFAECYDKSAKN